MAADAAGASLTTSEIVRTLGRLGMLELNGPSSWPELSEGADVHPISWADVEDRARATRSALDLFRPTPEIGKRG